MARPTLSALREAIGSLRAGLSGCGSPLSETIGATTGRVSSDGRLDRLALVRRSPVGRLPTRPGKRGGAWQVALELDFDPTALADYWLRNCHGFLIGTPSDQAMGVVDDVHLNPSTGEVVSIEASGGWFGRRRFTVPVERVGGILPVERRLLIAEGSTSPASKCLARKPRTNEPCASTPDQLSARCYSRHERPTKAGRRVMVITPSTAAIR
jgi:PRC-barrel domain protein